MSEIQDEAYAKACQEIERLREENSKLTEQWLELMDAQLFYTGLPGQMHRLNVKIEQLKSLLVRVADVLEKVPSDTDTHLVQKLRKEAE